MKKTLFYAVLITNTILNCANIYASTQPPIAISNVDFQKDTREGKAANFSTVIKITPNHNVTLNENSLFGFYMPRSFATVKNINPAMNVNINANPDLTMCITEDTGNLLPTCDNQINGKLVYRQIKDMRLADLSQGYTTVLSLTKGQKLQLKQGTKYAILLLNNNQWAPGNYSAVPQNFFFVQDKNKITATNVFYLQTKADTYLAGLKKLNTTTEADIQKHSQANWDNSIKYNGSDKNIIVPTPISYTITNDNERFLVPKDIIIKNYIINDDKYAITQNINLTVLQKSLKKIGKTSVSENNTIDDDKATILIKSASNITNPEGYQINITQEQIQISAINQIGVFYAIQSLNQLFYHFKNGYLPLVSIIDAPRFVYRGITLDTARHFFTNDEVKNLIDLMAIQKLNTLHIHFSDDEGFRLGLNGIKHQITDIADKRLLLKDPKVIVGSNMTVQANLDGANPVVLKDDKLYPHAYNLYSGTYSEADIKDLIKYASERNITIIPEIDLPGHARALIKAFPDELINPNDKSVYLSVQGYTDDAIPACDPNVANMILNKIVYPTAVLFNNQKTLYAINEVSLGGDEVSSGAWTNDSSCDATSYKGLNALSKSHLFFHNLADQMSPNILTSGWQQLVQNDDGYFDNHQPTAGQVGHVWVWATHGSINDKNGGYFQANQLAQANYPVVLAFADDSYHDVAYTPAIEEPGFTWSTPYSDTHSSLNLAASTLILAKSSPTLGDREKFIKGVEGALWSENLATYNHLIYMALPKMTGVAEAAWASTDHTVEYNTSSPDNSKINWQNLAGRLGCGNGNGFISYLQHSDININNYRGQHTSNGAIGIKLEAPDVNCNILNN